MKKTLAAAMLAGFVMTSGASAGGLADPILEPEVIEAETSSSDGGLLVPLFFLLVAAVGVGAS